MKRPFWWVGLSFHRLDWKQLSFKESYIRVNRLIDRWDGICINPCSDTALNCAHGEIDWFTFIINATRFRRLARGLESLQNLHILPKWKKKIFCFLLKEKKKIRRLPEDEAWQRSGWPQPKRTRSSFVIGRCFIFVNEWMIRNSFESHSFWLLKETNFLFIFFLFFVQDFRGLCKWWEAWIVTFFLFLFFPPSRRKRWAEWMKSAAAVSSAPPKMVNLPAGRPMCFAFENHF